MYGDGITVWKDKSKWACQLRFVHSDGRVSKHQRRRATRQEAISAIKDLFASLQEKEKSALKPTLQQLMPEFIAYKQSTVRLNTAADYKHQLELWVLPKIGHMKPAELKPKDVLGLMTDLKAEGKSTATVNTVRMRLSALMSYAVMVGQAQSNPCSHVRSFRSDGDKLVKEPWSLEEVSRALDACRGTQVELFMMLATLLGSRRGELLALRWGDVDFEKAELQIDKTRSYRRLIDSEGNLFNGHIESDPKTFSGFRRLPLAAPILVALMNERSKREQLEQSVFDSDHLLRGVKGEKLSNTTLDRHWNKFCDENSLRRIRIHDIRHTSIVQALEAGARLEEASQGAGHSSTEITKRIYARYVPALAHGFASALAERLVEDRTDTQGAFIGGGVDVEN